MGEGMSNHLAKDKDDYGFTFSGEAYEWFRGLADRGEGLCVCVTPQEGDPFDAELVGGDWESEWGDSIRVRRWNDHHSHGEGPIFSVRVRNIHIY